MKPIIDCPICGERTVETEETPLIYVCPIGYDVPNFAQHYAYSLVFDDDKEEFVISQEEWIFYPYHIMKSSIQVGSQYETIYFVGEDTTPGYRWHYNFSVKEFQERFPVWDPKNFKPMKEILDTYGTFA